MKIFILSILIVSFISLCFFKKKFWENRYLVLLIIGGVALVATLTTNYATRNKLGTRVETIRSENIRVFTVNNAFVDSNNIGLSDDKNLSGYLKGEDSTAVEKHARHLFYYNDGNLYIGFSTEKKLKSVEWEKIYIAPSQSDTVAYYAKLRQYYNKRSDNWVANISLPPIKTVTCLYLPPSEYASIPDSLINKLSL